MIISHTHKFIFFAVPKTGTHGMRRLLRPFLGVEDWEQENLFDKKRLPIVELANKNHGHITVQELRPHLSHEIWETYFKFAIVRDPCERFISICAFLLRNNPNKEEIMPRFVANALNRPPFRNKVLSQPQTSFLKDNNDDLSIDYFGKLEEMDKVIEILRKKIKLDLPLMETINKSVHKGYNHYATPNLSLQLQNYYKEDFHNFGYDLH